MVGPERTVDSHVRENASEDAHRMVPARILRIGLHALERGLGPDPVDFELGDEHRQVTRRVRDNGDGPLGREEAEAREVPDVVLVEEDATREPPALEVSQEMPASFLEL